MGISEAVIIVDLGFGRCRHCAGLSPLHEQFHEEATRSPGILRSLVSIPSQLVALLPVVIIVHCLRCIHCAQFSPLLHTIAETLQTKPLPDSGSSSSGTKKNKPVSVRRTALSRGLFSLS
jgi:hypothetical protein